MAIFGQSTTSQTRFLTVMDRRVLNWKGDKNLSLCLSSSTPLPGRSSRKKSCNLVFVIEHVSSFDSRPSTFNLSFEFCVLISKREQ
jgi:hypothetical protein